MKAVSFLLVFGWLAAGPALAAAPPPAVKKAPADVVKPSKKDAARTPAVVPTKPAPLPQRTTPPDGTFEGTLGDGKPTITVRLTVNAGFVTAGEARWGDKRMDLTPSGAPDAPELRLNGKMGRDYLRIDAKFDDDELGAGNYQGVLASQVVSGSWTLYRR